jgi:hypothetical protein
VYYVDAHRDTLLERFRASGLSKGMSYNLFYYMRRIEVNSGIDTLVKCFKTHYITLLNTKLENLVLIKRGPLRVVYSSFRYGSEKTKARALSIFKVVGLFRAPEPTLEDYNKKSHELKELKDVFHSSVRSSWDDNSVDYFNSLTVAPLSLKDYRYTGKLRMPLTSATIPILNPKRKDNTGNLLSRIAGYCSTPTEVFGTMILTPRLILSNYEYCKSVIGDILPTRTECADLIKSSKRDVVGRAIMLTKDRAMKRRLIASVSYHVQLLVNPIHTLLKDFLKKHPSCYCFDQEAGIARVEEWLSNGEEVSSLDLLNATDGVPLSLQVEVLRKSLKGHRSERSLQMSLKFFAEACPLSYETPYGTFIKWYRGSPMGMRGSYYLFNFYLISLFESFDIPRDAFVIVGDDLVVLGRYTEIVVDLISKTTSSIQESKSIYNSSTFAEFCGRVITSNGVLQVYKANIEDTKNDPTGLLRQYGVNKAHRFRSLLSLDNTTLLQYKAKAWLDVNNMHQTVSDLLGDNNVIEPPMAGGLTPYQYFRLGYLDEYVFKLLTYLQYSAILKVNIPADKVHDISIILENFLYENYSEAYQPDDPFQEFDYGFDTECAPYPSLVDSTLRYINAQYEHDIQGRFLPTRTFVPFLSFEKYYTINSVAWGKLGYYFMSDVPFDPSDDTCEFNPSLMVDAPQFALEQASEAAEFDITEQPVTQGEPYFEELIDRSVVTKTDLTHTVYNHIKDSTCDIEQVPEPRRFSDEELSWKIGSPAESILFLTSVFLPMLPIILLVESFYDDSRDCPLVPRLRALFSYIVSPKKGK